MLIFIKLIMRDYVYNDKNINDLIMKIRYIYIKSM